MRYSKHIIKLKKSKNTQMVYYICWLLEFYQNIWKLTIIEGDFLTLLFGPYL